MVNLDFFFNLGNKATRGDPIRKSQFDYELYWIVFLAFVFLALNYYYNFFFKGAGLSTLIWAFIITIFCWFNYWGLVAFRGVYMNMKKAGESLKKINEDNKDNDEDINDVLNNFK